MQIRNAFTLTSGDTVEIDDVFQIKPGEAVPEPGTLAFLAVGFAVVAGLRLRALGGSARAQPPSFSRRSARRCRLSTGRDGARTPNARRSRRASSSSGVGGGVRSS